MLVVWGPGAKGLRTRSFGNSNGPKVRVWISYNILDPTIKAHIYMWTYIPSYIPLNPKP